MATVIIHLKVDKDLHRQFKAWTATHDTTMQDALVQMISATVGKAARKG